MASTESRDDLTGTNRTWNSGSTSDQRSSEEIRRDIERQRNELDVTTEVLQHKLAPRELAEQLWHDVRTRVGGGAGDVVDVVKRHPVPLGLIGAGLAWWIYETSTGHSLAFGNGGDEDYTDYDSDYGVGSSSTGSYAAGYPASDYESEYGEHEEGWRERSRELAHRSSERLRSGAHTARQGFSDAMDRNPLALGAACFSLGILAGIAVPSTRWEHETMGGPARKVGRRAKRAAADAAATAAHTAAERAEQIREQAEHAGMHPEHHEPGRYGQQSTSSSSPARSATSGVGSGWTGTTTPSSGSYGTATSGSKTGAGGIGTGGTRSGSTGIGSTGPSTGTTGTGTYGVGSGTGSTTPGSTGTSSTGQPGRGATPRETGKTGASRDATKRKPGDASDGPDPWDPQDPGRQRS